MGEDRRLVGGARSEGSREDGCVRALKKVGEVVSKVSSGMKSGERERECEEGSWLSRTRLLCAGIED